jgi:hypothetical protein
MLLDGVDASEIRTRLTTGEISCREVADAFLRTAVPDQLNAWVTIDAERLLEQARALDALPGPEKTRRTHSTRSTR